ncbi:MAG: prepilin peptidase [Alphaproteobacteria bacterium]|nr:prepilin peptidase [Alphaproteobacteria bacterium]
MNSYIFFTILLLISAYLSVRISISDFRHRIIPDIYLFPLMLTGLVLTGFFSYPIDIYSGIIGGIFGYIMAVALGFIFVHIPHKPATTPIGLGDIKLIGVGGIWLGITGLSIALVISCIAGMIWSYIHKEKYIPFAPFFLLGGFLSLIGMTFLI